MFLLDSINLLFFLDSFILDVWQASKHASVIKSVTFYKVSCKMKLITFFSLCQFICWNIEAFLIFQIV